MPLRRRTLAREATLEGTGLHEGLETHLTLRPAAAGTGICFRRADLGAGADAIPAHISALEGRPRRTALVRGAAAVETVEHLLAAVAGLGVTDLEVEIDRVEVPGFDGSAREFAAALRRAGLVDLEAAAPVLRLDRAVEVHDAGGARAVALPCPGRLVLEYVLDYGGGGAAALGPEAAARLRAHVEVEVGEEGFEREFAPARTFCLEEEALALKAAGFGRGATTANTLVIGRDGLPLENALRFPDEYARHKALDLLGDLALLGMRLEARVIAYRSGHALNAALVRELAALAAAGASAPEPAPAPAPVPAPVSAPAPVFAPDRMTPPTLAFDGHFPGDPVLPGVALLSALRAGAGLSALEGVKFRRAVRPGTPIALEWTGLGGGRVRVRATAAGEVVADGVLLVEGDD